MVCDTRCNMLNLMQIIFNYIKNYYYTLTSCPIDKYFNSIDKSMQQVLDRCSKIEKQLEEEIKILSAEVDNYKGMLNSIAEAIPDMLWCKDLDGKYIYTNSAINTGLLFDYNPIGKDDIELSTNAKLLFGNENHTFGEICGNSDLVVIEKAKLGIFSKEDGRFLESGLIKGKMLYLEVFKAPFYVNGELKGVVGTGRNMTDYVLAFRERNCRGCQKMDDIFKKYEYEG